MSKPRPTRGVPRSTVHAQLNSAGDTIHLALGQAYGETVGVDREQNDSALRLDMIVDMSGNSYIEVDGEVIQRNGVSSSKTILKKKR